MGPLLMCRALVPACRVCVLRLSAPCTAPSGFDRSTQDTTCRNTGPRHGKGCVKPQRKGLELAVGAVVVGETNSDCHPLQDLTYQTTGEHAVDGSRHGAQ